MLPCLVLLVSLAHVLLAHVLLALVPLVLVILVLVPLCLEILVDARALVPSLARALVLSLVRALVPSLALARSCDGAHRLRVAHGAASVG